MGNRSGKVPSSYEESKQWLDVYNLSTEHGIEPFCPCVLVTSALYANPEDGKVEEGTLGVLPLNKFESIAGETGLYGEDGGLRPIAVNGAVRIPPKRHGRVTQDWPVLAKVDGGEKSLEEIAETPVFPSSSGFRPLKTRVSEARYYWRRQLAYAVLGYPEGEKSGLCWVQDALSIDETPLRLIPFRVLQLDLTTGFSSVQIRPLWSMDDAVAEVRSNQLWLYSLGKWDFYLNLQLRGDGDLTDAANVPRGTLNLKGEFSPTEELPNGQGEVQVLIDEVNNNNLTLTYDMSAIITGLSHAGGSYDCASVVMGFDVPEEWLNWHRAFSLRTAGATELRGLVGRELAATLRLYASWLPEEDAESFDVEIVSGSGYLALRSESTRI